MAIRIHNCQSHVISCVAGCFGCRWRRYLHSRDRSSLCDLFWLLFQFVTGAYVWFHFYYWLLAENSVELMNWYAFSKLHSYINAYTIFFVLTCITLAYIILLFILTLCHLLLGLQLYLHPVHRVILVLVLVMCIVITIGLDVVWSDGWKLMQISLMITAPFLHIAGVVVMTAASWFIPGLFFTFRCRNPRIKTIVKVFWAVLYIAVMLLLYLSPLGIKSPCIVNEEDLPRKPQLVAHKGASAIAPENTLIAFEYAAKYKVIAFESDVSFSLDGVPFVLHDASLRRTTNIGNVFPDLQDLPACMLNISQIRQLDAGSWFLKDDPYGIAKTLSSAEKQVFSSQIIPTLEELLQLAMQHNVSVMFDVKPVDSHLCPDNPFLSQYGQIIVNTTERIGFPANKMWWLYHKDVPTEFCLVSAGLDVQPSELLSNGISIVNFGFQSILSSHYFGRYKENNISVNLYVIDSKWLFSLCWCLGVSSITTNNCQLFAALNRPVWHLTPQQFLAMWLTVDVVSAVIVVVFWVIQRSRLHPSVEVDVDSISLQLTQSEKDLYSPVRRRQMFLTAENNSNIGTLTPDY